MGIEELKDVAIRVCGEKSSEVKNLLKHIESMNGLRINEGIHNDFGLNDVEILTLIMLEGFASNLIQRPAFNPKLKNEFNRILITSLDNALLKIPRTSHNTLYRQDCEYGMIPKANDVLIIKGFFTASKDDFDNTHCIKWIIKPLSNGHTKAHDIYNVYNHGLEYGNAEWQVEFERNTKFIVTKVVPQENFTEVYISELED